MMNSGKRKCVSMKVHPRLYEQIEKERREFMKKNNLDRLSTVAFTGLMRVKYEPKKKFNKTKKKR